MSYQNDSFRVGLVQHPCSSDVKENRALAAAGVREAKKMGAQIICLQELFNTSYFPSRESSEFFSLAEEITGQSVAEMQQLAASLGVVLIAPIFEKRAPGVYHNSAAVIDADGALLGVYRKMHIPDDPLFFEKYYFAPGEASGTGNGFQVFNTKFARIGVLICWDQWYPEGARITSLLGAEVLFYPTAIGFIQEDRDSDYSRAQRDAWRTIQRSHAIANGVYVAAPNRVGLEETPGTGGIEFFGGSFVADPNGVVMAEASSEKSEVLVTECSRKRIEQIRHDWPFLRDRRIDAYSGIERRYLGDLKK